MGQVIVSDNFKFSPIGLKDLGVMNFLFGLQPADCTGLVQNNAISDGCYSLPSALLELQ